MGVSDPDLLLLGEGPGTEENATGKPFQGGSGRILHVWRSQAGIAETPTWIDNVIQHQPPGNDIDLADIGAEVPGLFKRILRVNPKLIVLMGNTPLHVFVTGTITDWRGSYFPITIGGRIFKAVATFHPAYIMRQRKMWDVVIHDLKKAKRLAQTPGPYTEPPTNYIIDPSEAELRREQERNLDEKLPVTVDIETDMQGLAIDRIGFGNRPGTACSVPLDASTMFSMLRFVSRIPEIATQNGYAFDIPKLRDAGFRIPYLHHDTLLYAHVLYNHLPLNLAFLGSIYTDYYYHKDQAQERPEWYNCRDVDMQTQVLAGQFRELRERNLLPLAAHTMRSANLVMKMQARGMKIDVEVMRQLQMDCLGREAHYETQLQRDVGDPTFNPRSTQQLRAALNARKVAIPYNRKKKGYVLDKDALKTIAGQACKAPKECKAASEDKDANPNKLYLHPCGDPIALMCAGTINVRENRKLASTYYSLNVGDKGRVFPNWKMGSTAKDDDEDLK
jgi:uracil-DNA glycosylase family 4